MFHDSNGTDRRTVSPSETAAQGYCSSRSGDEGGIRTGNRVFFLQNNRADSTEDEHYGSQSTTRSVPFQPVASGSGPSESVITIVHGTTSFVEEVVPSNAASETGGLTTYVFPRAAPQSHDAQHHLEVPTNGIAQESGTSSTSTSTTPAPPSDQPRKHSILVSSNRRTSGHHNHHVTISEAPPTSFELEEITPVSPGGQHTVDLEPPRRRKKSVTLSDRVLETESEKTPVEGEQEEREEQEDEDAVSVASEAESTSSASTRGASSDLEDEEEDQAELDAEEQRRASVVTNPDEEKPAELPFKDVPLKQVLKKLETSPKGLTSAEASKRLAQHGRNALPEPKQNPVKQFMRFMWNPLSWAMEAGAILAIIILDWADFGLIIFLLFLNATIGFWEEHKAGNAIAALKSQLSPNAKVKRDGEWTVIPSTELVPGDIIRLKLGDVVPADAKLLPGDHLKVDQSSLTGESLAVNKYTGDEVFSGTIVKHGEQRAVVYATGTNTFFGRAAGLVAATVRHGHFQIVMRNIGWFCISFIAIFVIAELVVQLARGKGCAIRPSGEHCYLIGNLIVLIAGGIPVAMPTVLSVTMAIGAGQLAAKQAIVTRLSAVEELAGMNVLCSDKTGTLTLNKLTISDPYVVPGVNKEQLLLDAALASNPEDNDAIDLAILNYYDPERTKTAQYKRVKFVPFDPVGKKTMATVRDPQGTVFKVSKGAPQVILNFAANKDVIEQEVIAKIDEFARAGYRSLGVSRATDKHGSEWIMEGLIPLFDQPRHDTKKTIETAISMGVDVKMITGDQLAIAKETAKMLGMGSDRIYSASVFRAKGEVAHDAHGAAPAPAPANAPAATTTETTTTTTTAPAQATAPVPARAEASTASEPAKAKLKRLFRRKKKATTRTTSTTTTRTIAPAGAGEDEAPPNPELMELIEQSDGFAQVFPEHKYEVVRLLQKMGHVVGMTGDGVNDAPALKKADIGIAVAGATDAARAASDIVLLAPGLSVIVDAIIGSRKIFKRMKNYAMYSITVTIRIVLTFSILVLAWDFNFPPFLIVILAVLNDGCILTISKDRVKPNPFPEAWYLSEVFLTAVSLGTWLVASTITLYVLAVYTDFFQSAFDVRYLTHEELVALIYLQVSISGMSTIFVTRARYFSWMDRPSFLLLLAFAVAQAAATCISIFGFGGWSDVKGMGGGWALIVWIWCFVWFLPMDFIKLGVHWIYRKFLYRHKVITKPPPLELSVAALMPFMYGMVGAAVPATMHPSQPSVSRKGSLASRRASLAAAQAAAAKTKESAPTAPTTEATQLTEPVSASTATNTVPPSAPAPGEIITASARGISPPPMATSRDAAGAASVGQSHVVVPMYDYSQQQQQQLSGDTASSTAITYPTASSSSSGVSRSSSFTYSSGYSTPYEEADEDEDAARGGSNATDKPDSYAISMNRNNTRSPPPPSASDV